MSDLETIAFRWQFCGGYDEESSDEVRAWEGAHGDLCLAVANRTPTGQWQLGCGDAWAPDAVGMEVLFHSARSAIEYIAKVNGAVLVEAACRCGTGGECD